MFLQLLAPVMQDDHNTAAIKVVLKLAKSKGLNPKKLYKQALQTHSSGLPVAPALETVFPL